MGLETMHELVDLVAQAIEVMAVLIVVAGIIYGIASYSFRCWQAACDPYKWLKDEIGKTLLLGLEFLIAADIIKTVTLDLSLQSILLLGLLVLIRLFLSWSLVVEIEGRWPWQMGRAEPGGPPVKQDNRPIKKMVD